MLPGGSRPLRLFYSYSHKDAKMRDRLEDHLGMLRRAGHIEQWHDRKIQPGAEWDRQISEHLDKADIILLLVDHRQFRSIGGGGHRNAPVLRPNNQLTGVIERR